MALIKIMKSSKLMISYVVIVFGGFGAVGEVEMHVFFQLPVSTPLTKPSHSRNHCMLMQYMTTGDSSSWNVLFSYGAEQRAVGWRNKRGRGRV